MTLKDHLRSLSDKQPPDDPKKSADSAAATPSDSPSDAPTGVDFLEGDRGLSGHRYSGRENREGLRGGRRR